MVVQQLAQYSIAVFRISILHASENGSNWSMETAKTNLKVACFPFLTEYIKLFH